MIYGDFEVQLTPGKITFNFDNELTLTKGGETTKEENFVSVYPSKIYNLAIIAHEIIASETRYCYFNKMGFSLAYPEFSIERKTVGSDWKLGYIYFVEDVKSKEKLAFAVRGCAMPGGL